MKEKQKNNTYTKVHANVIESGAYDQIKLIANSPALRGLVAIMPDVHIGKGCVIGFTGHFDKAVIPNLIGVDIGCFSGDTEFLTEKGWKKISEYVEGDKVLQYNKKTDEASFTNPINYIVKDCEEFFHFKNSKGLDQMISEEHKMLVFKGYKNKGYKTADMQPKDLQKIEKSLDKNYYNFKASFDINNKGIKLTDDEIKLDCMICADGCMRHNNTRVELHFKKKRKISRAIKLLDRLGLQYKKTLVQDNSTFIYFKNPKRFNKDLSKYWKANKSQLKVLADESLLWDGHEGYRSFFSSTNKESADIIQFAFSSNNIRAGISKVKHPKWNTVYVVTPTKNNMVGFNNKIKKVKSKDGKKYCFTVPTGYLVVRRNGKIFVTGNCGVMAYPIGKGDIDFEKLDAYIRQNIPLGFCRREISRNEPFYKEVEGRKLVTDLNKVAKKVSNYSGVYDQIGTLGGGNHFVEIGENEDGERYLLIHSGSRNIGKQIAEYYQKKAVEICKAMQVGTPKDLEYLPLEFGGNDYLIDMKLAQEFASLNRKVMLKIILRHLNIKFNEDDLVESVHNYIGKDNIIRKGAISAYNGEKVIIPFNMAEGSIIGIGKSNKDYNFSAPHGAGRVSGRKEMKRKLRAGEVTMKDFEDSMKGIFSTSIKEATIDESKFAYKSFDDVKEHLNETVDIEMRLKPIYNLKSV